ncbi:MAG: STM4504/CBY_0614 family protein [Psychrobacter sp.]
MAVHDLYFKRQKNMTSESLDAYQYANFPMEFRVQVSHILMDVFYDIQILDFVKSKQSTMDFNGNLLLMVQHTDNEMRKICKIFCREKGRLSLKGKTNKVTQRNDYQAIFEFIFSEYSTDDFLTIIELTFGSVENEASKFSFGKRENAKEISHQAVLELNQRFHEHGIGYQYENGQIIRIDSELIHAEAVKPALQLLSHPSYKGAQEEFLSAHEHYSHGRYDSSLTDCLKAFESTMKIIIHKRSWICDKNATSKKLIDCCLSNELIPKFWTDQFNSLSNILTSSIGTPRNKLSGHGKGNDDIEVPEHLIQYVLHMTASTIVFLIKAEESLN